MEISTVQAEQAVLDLLARRAPDATICPSEAARALAGAGGAFQPLMGLVREAAETLAKRGEVRITQRGTVVELARVRGPVRIGRAVRP